MTVTAIYPWQQALWQKIGQQRGTRQHHALLLTGRAGIGKLAWARSLAKAKLCEQVNADAIACGMCASCGWFEQNQHPNFRFLTSEALSEAPDHADAATASGSSGEENPKSKKKPGQQITISQIRELDDFVYLSAHQQSDRLVLIHPAEAMNQAAANALLKKLEEPPPNVIFILVTNDASALLATIRSRCQQIVMPLPDREVAQDWLKKQGIDHAEVRLAMSGYAPLLAMQFDESWFEHYQLLTRFLSAPDSLDVVDLTGKLHQFDLLSIVDWMQKWCFDLMSCRATGKVRYHLQKEKVIQKLAEKINPLSLAFLWRDLTTSRRWARHPVNPKLFIEDILFRYLEDCPKLD